MELKLKKLRPMLFKKRHVMKFYPILPYERRVKTPKSERPTYTNVPIRFNRVMSSIRTLDATGAKNVYLNVNTWVTTGANSARTFQKNVDWKTLVAKGQNATYPYSRTGGTCKPILYSGSSSGGGQTSFSYGSVMGSVLVDQHDLTVLSDIAISRLKNRLNGYIGNAQLQAPIAESREIHRIVRQINGLGLSTLKAVLAIKKSRGKSAAKQFGDIWLGFGFGVNPMLKDIEKAANSVLDYTTRQDRHVRVSGTASQDYQTSGVSNLDVIAEGVLMDVYSYGSHVQGVKFVAGIDLKIRSAASYGVTDHLGLGISDIPSTIWELVPFSWVVDYAFTVGPWLEDMFYTLPGTVKYVSKSTKYQSDVNLIPKLVLGANYKCSVLSSPGRFRYFSFARTSLTALPYRQLRVKTMDEVAKGGVSKLLNLASVLAGRRGPNLSTPVRERRRRTRLAP